MTAVETQQIVYILDDDQAMRNSIVALVESVGYKAMAFGSVDSFLAVRPEQTRGCLILDVRLPGMSGVELLEKLRSQNIEIPAVMITGFGDIQTAVRAIHAGAVDFLEKPFHEQRFLDLVSQCFRQDQEQAESVELLHVIQARVSRLTQREKQVLDEVVNGLSNREIAEQFGLSTRTVEIHRANVMQKMEAGSLAELVKFTLLMREAA